MSSDSCIQHTTTTSSRRFNIFKRESHKKDKYIGKNFFHGNNYELIIKCLDDGYYVGKNLIQSMVEYKVLQQNEITHRNEYRKTCDLRLKKQSPLSSYNTTLDVQYENLEPFSKREMIEQQRCEIIQEVIDQYQTQMDAMYPSVRLGRTRKHYRTHELENRFKRARSPLCKVLKTLKNLHKKRGRTQNILQNINVKIQNLSLDSKTNEEKIIIQINEQKKKENKLKEIEENIAQAEEKRQKEEINYIQEATKIFQECQQSEKERLDQIRQTLINFNRAVHSRTYSNELDLLYKKYISNIKTYQNSTADLDYWAQTYGVNDPTIVCSSQTNENEIDDDSAIVEDDNKDE